VALLVTADFPFAVIIGFRFQFSTAYLRPGLADDRGAAREPAGAQLGPVEGDAMIRSVYNANLRRGDAGKGSQATNLSGRRIVPWPKRYICDLLPHRARSMGAVAFIKAGSARVRKAFNIADPQLRGTPETHEVGGHRCG